MSEPEAFYAIRRTDGDLIHDYGWLGCADAEDWATAEAINHCGATEYEIVRMVVEPLARRTFGTPTPDDEATT